MGGTSAERDVSLASGLRVAAALRSSGHTVTAIDTVRGVLTEAEEGALLASGVMRTLPPEHETLEQMAAQALPATVRAIPAKTHADVVFLGLHGGQGEDGTIQGLLEMAAVPFVGCGTLASACGMDKVTMKALFKEAGLPICGHTWFLRSEWERDKGKVGRRVTRSIGFPAFVKPANLGSSVGVSKATDRASLSKAISLAARYDRKIIVEEAVDGRELECAVMGNDKPQASLPGEYVIHDEAARFLDYTEKYSSTGNVEFVVPAKVSKATVKRIQQMAVKAYQAIDGAGLSRVDFFLQRDGDLLVNEINTLPGLTDVSGFPKMWKASGIPFPRVIDQLIKFAIERHRERARNETSI